MNTETEPTTPLEQEVERLRQIRDEAEAQMIVARNELELSRIRNLIGKCFSDPGNFHGPVVYKVVGIGRDVYHEEDLVPILVKAQRSRPGASQDRRSFELEIRPSDMLTHGEVPTDWQEITEAQFQQEFRNTMAEASRLAFIPPDYDADVPPLPSTDDDEGF